MTKESKTEINTLVKKHQEKQKQALLESRNSTEYYKAEGNYHSSVNQNIIRQLVDRDIYSCVSMLIYDMAQKGDEEAMDLSCHVNYISAAENIDIENCEDWAQVCIDCDIDLDEQGKQETDENYQKRAFDAVKESDATPEKILNAAGIDPDQDEIYEHWIVSDWLAEKLAAKGEKTGDYHGLTIWGRGCTGQAILLDCVIGEIAADMQILEGQRNDWSK